MTRTRLTTLAVLTVCLASCGGGGGGSNIGPTTYTVGGELTGLAAHGTITLENNAADALTLTGNGAFTLDLAVHAPGLG